MPRIICIDNDLALIRNSRRAGEALYLTLCIHLSNGDVLDVPALSDTLDHVTCFMSIADVRKADVDFASKKQIVKNHMLQRCELPWLLCVSQALEAEVMTTYVEQGIKILYRGISRNLTDHQMPR